MMTETPPELMSFEEFREAVGASDYTVRRALAVLRLRPEPGYARRTFYRREWVERVRAEVERMRQ